MYANPTGFPPQYAQPNIEMLPVMTQQQQQFIQQPPVPVEMYQQPIMTQPMMIQQGFPQQPMTTGKPLPIPPSHQGFPQQPMTIGATQVINTTTSSIQQNGSFYGQSVDVAVIPPHGQQQTQQPYNNIVMNPVNPMMVNSTLTMVPQQQQVNPADLKNVEDYDLLNNNLKSCRFADGETMLMFIVKLIIECAFFPGIGTFLCINYRTRREIKEMRFGNRKLGYKSRGNYKLAMLYFVDAMLILFTLGLWYILGKSHEFFWSQVDARIYWGKPIHMKKRKKATFQDFLVWEPQCEGNGLGTMKIYSVYLGVVDELIYLIMKGVSVSTFGLFQPFVDAFYYPKYFAKVDLGVGRFCVIHPQMITAINEHAKKKKLKKAPPPAVPLDIYPSIYPVYGYPHRPEHSLYKLRLKFETKGSRMCKLVSYHMCERTITVLTCTLFQVTGLNELYQHHFRNKFIRIFVDKCIEQPPPVYYTQGTPINSTTLVTTVNQVVINQQV